MCSCGAVDAPEHLDKMRVILPPPVKVGDKVSLIAPASPINLEYLELGIALLGSWGLEAVVDPQAYSKCAYVAGSDQERTRALIDAFDDEQTSAVLCLNGGYGCTRLAPFISPDKLDPRNVCSKRFFGFSDVTALHCALRAAIPGYVSFHAPMLATSTFVEAKNESREALHNALFASSLKEICPAIKGRCLQMGRASHNAGIFRGRVVGGNLSLLSSVAGTAWQVDLEGCIILIEDVNEALYRLDRMFTQLLMASKGQSGVLKRSALVLGNFGTAFEDYASKNTEETVDDVKAWFWLEQMGLPPDLPILIDVPIGHITDNRVVALGAMGEIDFNSAELRFEDALILSPDEIQQTLE